MGVRIGGVSCCTMGVKVRRGLFYSQCGKLALMEKFVCTHTQLRLIFRIRSQYAVYYP